MKRKTRAVLAQGDAPTRNPRIVTAEGAERVGKRITRVNPDDGSRTVAVTIDEVYQARPPRCHGRRNRRCTWRISRRP